MKNTIKEFRDGLTQIKLLNKFPWMLTAEYTSAVIGIRDGKLIWYEGTWEDKNNIQPDKR